MTKILVAIFVVVALSLLFAPIPAHAIAGDTNGDGTVNALDFSILAAAYLSYPAEHHINPPYNARWDARADFNGDLIINALDFSILAMNYGE